MPNDPDLTGIETVEELIELVAAGRGASDSPGDGGERVDLLDHALQCAHELALRHRNDDELQIAGLLHDIGHQIVPGDDAGHGTAGGDAVRGLLGDRVATLIAHHVPAKRYLVATDPEYRSTLSPTSIRTLENQGGAMTADEIAAWQTVPHWEAGLELRRADEAAKVHGRAVPGLTSWRPVLECVAARHRSP